MAKNKQAAEAVIEDYAEPIKTGDSGFLGIRMTAILELLIFFTVLICLDLLFFDGTRYWDVQPHPFWIIVLLVSVQYGTAEGLVAALTASAALLLFNIPEQSVNQDLYDFLLSISYRPLMWLCSVIFIGGLRARQMRRQNDLIRAVVERDRKLQKITEAYDLVNNQKNKLEGRVAGQLNTAIELYNTAREVEKLESAKVLVSALDLVRTIIGPTQVSIFMLVDDMLQAGLQKGWGPDDAYLRFFRSDTQLFRTVVAERRMLNITRPEDEAVLMGQGLMAGPLINRETGEVSGMLKVEKLPFINLNLSTVKSFEVLCEWIGTLLANARSYREIEQNALVEEHGLMSQRMYEKHLGFLRSLSGRIGFEVSMVKIQLEQPHRLPPEKRKRAARALSEVVQHSLRYTDYAFDYLQRGWSYIILLPGNNIDGAMIVVEKVRTRFERLLADEVPEARFTIEAEKLK